VNRFRFISSPIASRGEANSETGPIIEGLTKLIQIDGCDHEWFEERAPRCTLLVFVDDATGALMELRFCESESAFSYFAAMRAYLEQHGKPVALYSDKAGVFRVNKKEARGGAGITQFGRALSNLNIDILCANTPRIVRSRPPFSLSEYGGYVKSPGESGLGALLAGDSSCLRRTG
jgi:hypothetical protein